MKRGDRVTGRLEVKKNVGRVWRDTKRIIKYDNE